MILSDTNLHPYALLIFGLAGAFMYFCFEVLRAFFTSNAGKRLVVFRHVADAFFVLLSAISFVLITEFLFEGLLKYYTILSFASGVAVSRIVFKQLIRKFLHKTATRYRAFVKKHTNVSRKRLNEANDE
jgi:hypothetical protein